MCTEPVDEHLLILCEQVVAYGHVEQQRQRYEPQQHAQPCGGYGKGRDDHREGRAVVVQVEVFCRVMDVERQLLHDMPELILENQEVVFPSVSEAIHAADGYQHPHPQQRAWVCQYRFQFFFHWIGLN